MSEVNTSGALSSGDHHHHHHQQQQQQQQHYQHQYKYQSVIHPSSSNTNFSNRIHGAFLPPGLLLPSSEEEEDDEEEEEHTTASNSITNSNNNCNRGSHHHIHNEVTAMNRDDGGSDEFFKMDYPQSINVSLPPPHPLPPLIYNHMGSSSGRFHQSRMSQLRDDDRNEDDNGFLHSYPHSMKISDGRTAGGVGSQYATTDNSSGIGLPPILFLGENSKGERTINDDDDDHTWAFNGFHDVFANYNSTTPLNQSSNSSNSSSYSNSYSNNSNSSSRTEYLHKQQPSSVVKPSSGGSGGGLLVAPTSTQSSHPCYNNNNNNNNYTSSTSLNEWLPHVLVGFPQEWIQSSCDKLIDEGFLVVNDLIIAKQLQQLTYEYLQHTIGFKIGHCNRLMMELDKVKEGKSCHDRK